MHTQSLLNVIVIGGSYVGSGVAKKLAAALPITHRVILIEPHSHFHHLFAFPRFASLSLPTQKTFIPYTSLFPTASPHIHIPTSVTSIHPTHVSLSSPFEGSTTLPFDYCIIATGCKLTPPGGGFGDIKSDGVAYLSTHQKQVQQAQKIIIVGGGAVGIQLSTDIKETYPEKDVVLVHSRETMMNRFHHGLDQLCQERLKELGVKMILGKRVVLPVGGWEGAKSVQLVDGTTVSGGLIIPAIGQTPNTSLIKTLNPSLIASNGYLKVLPTLQLSTDPVSPTQEGKKYETIFAIGDVADTGAGKAARPGMAQGEVVIENVLAMIEGKEAARTYEAGGSGIHLSLGIKKNVVFRSPEKDGDEPVVIMREDGVQDLGIERVWVNRGVIVKREEDYHL